MESIATWRIPMPGIFCLKDAWAYIF
jgi:hypothetical protein